MRQRGFTMVELVTVMIVLGVLSAMAIPRLMSNSWTGVTWRQEVLSALRYAQKSAVSHRRLVCANVQANQVTLQIASGNPANACNTTFPAPDNQQYTSRDNSVAAGGLLGVMYFQPDGRITSDGNGNNNIGAGAITIKDAANSAIAANIRIDGDTGHVE